LNESAKAVSVIIMRETPIQSKLVPRMSFRQRFLKDDPKDTRRRQLQESLKQLEEDEKKLFAYLLEPITAE